MFGDLVSTAPGPDLARARSPRDRSLLTARKFRAAVLFAAVHYLGILATMTALWMVFWRPSEAAVHWFVGGLVFCAVSWLAAFFKRRSAVCPLCKGTPLVNSGARPHLRAKRLVPLNHGTTAMISIMACQKFRCMYCSADFDLLKPPSRARDFAPAERRLG